MDAPASKRPTDLSIWRKGVIVLLEDVYWVLVTHVFTRFLQVQVLFRKFYKVDYYQEFGYTVSSSGSLGLGLMAGPRVFG